MAPLNIWIYNHYATTPRSPGGTRHFDLAKKLTEQGHRVKIFASGFQYVLLRERQDYKGRPWKIENIEGVNFVWVKTMSYKSNDWRRIGNMASYYRNAVKAGKDQLQTGKPDYIIGSTVHPFAALAAKKVAKKAQSPFIFEIRDLWPQTFLDMGIWKKNSPQAILFKFLEKRLVTGAQGIIALSPLTIEYLEREYSLNATPFQLIPNGVDISRFQQKKDRGYNSMFEVIYLGGVDQVHNLEVLLKAAAVLKDRGEDEIRIKIVGEGKERQRLMHLCRERNLDNIQWEGPVSKSEVPDKLQEADTLFLTTSKVLYGSENKLYEYLASGKPVIIATHGAHNDPVSEAECGISVDPENPVEMAEAMIRFSSMGREKLAEMGAAGRKLAEKSYSTDSMAGKLINLIHSIQSTRDH